MTDPPGSDCSACLSETLFDSLNHAREVIER
jgi:hypothetical protein